MEYKFSESFEKIKPNYYTNPDIHFKKLKYNDFMHENDNESNISNKILSKFNKEYVMPNKPPLINLKNKIDKDYNNASEFKKNNYKDNSINNLNISNNDTINYKEEYKELNNLLIIKNDNILKLEKIIIKLDIKIKNLENNNSKKNIRNLNEKSDFSEITFNKIQNDIIQKNEIIEIYEKELNYLKKEIEDKDNVLDYLQKDLENFCEENTEINKLLDNKNNQLKELTNQNKLYKSKFQNLSNEIYTLKNNNDNLNNIINRQTSKMKSLLEKNKNLESINNLKNNNYNKKDKNINILNSKITFK